MFHFLFQYAFMYLFKIYNLIYFFFNFKISEVEFCGSFILVPHFVFLTAQASHIWWTSNVLWGPSYFLWGSDVFCTITALVCKWHQVKVLRLLSCLECCKSVPKNKGVRKLMKRRNGSSHQNRCLQVMARDSIREMMEITARNSNGTVSSADNWIL